MEMIVSIHISMVLGKRGCGLPMAATSGESDSSAERMTEWKGMCPEENGEVTFIDGERARHLEEEISTEMGTERRQEASTPTSCLDSCSCKPSLSFFLTRR